MTCTMRRNTSLGGFLVKKGSQSLGVGVEMLENRMGHALTMILSTGFSTSHCFSYFYVKEVLFFSFMAEPQSRISLFSQPKGKQRVYCF